MICPQMKSCAADRKLVFVLNCLRLVDCNLLTFATRAEAKRDQIKSPDASYGSDTDMVRPTH
jgi:hypothetical protein